MKRLDERPRPDVVSDLLGTLRVRSTLFCESRLTAPWGFSVERSGGAVFHLLLSGSCLLEVDGTGEARRLSAGDLVVLPGGHAHALRDRPTSPAPELDQLLAARPDFDGTLDHGGGGPATQLLCGGLTLEDGAANSLLARLGPVLHARGESGRAAGGLDDPIRLTVAELRQGRPGAFAVLSRLADILLAQAICRALAESDGAAAPLPALADPQIGAALSLIHRRPDEPWTTAELARRVTLSRSAFCSRFKRLIGEPPVSYLRRTRLSLAAAHLQGSDMPLAGIASLVGYDSDVSLSKAFRRQFGVAPGAYRRAAPERLEVVVSEKVGRPVSAPGVPRARRVP